MNKENLLKMADYIETVPEEMFHMRAYRNAGIFGRTEPHCKTIGCIVGHCTILDKNILPKNEDGGINFLYWSELFTGINYDSHEWEYLFSSDWIFYDNTPTGAAKRIRHFVEKGLPADWYEQMNGETPLSY